MSDSAQFQSEIRDGVAILRLLTARIRQTGVITELEDDLLEFLDQARPRRVIIDFKKVTNCSTAVINGLLRAKKRLISWNGTLALCGMRKVIRDAFRVLNLEGTVFPIYESLDDALHDS